MTRDSIVRRGVALALSIVAAGCFAPRASAQGLDPDQERARQLVVRIRKSMREIDSLLLSGAQPEKVEKELAANQKRIEDLLKETESKSQAVIQNIDELIKLAKYQQSKQQPPPDGGGGGGGDPQQNPKRDKSQDPKELQKQQQQQGQQPESPQNEKNQRQPGEQPPKKGGPDQSKPKQQQSDRPPPQGETGKFERPDTSGRWGMLPPKEAEDLQRRDAEEFPLRYRRWMELYFLRVNKLSGDH